MARLTIFTTICFLLFTFAKKGKSYCLLNCFVVTNYLDLYESILENKIQTNFCSLKNDDFVQSFINEHNVTICTKQQIIEYLNCMCIDIGVYDVHKFVSYVYSLSIDNKTCLFTDGMHGVKNYIMIILKGIIKNYKYEYKDLPHFFENLINFKPIDDKIMSANSQLDKSKKLISDAIIKYVKSHPSFNYKHIEDVGEMDDYIYADLKIKDKFHDETKQQLICLINSNKNYLLNPEKYNHILPYDFHSLFKLKDKITKDSSSDKSTTPTKTQEIKIQGTKDMTKRESSIYKNLFILIFIMFLIMFILIYIEKKYQFFTKLLNHKFIEKNLKIQTTKFRFTTSVDMK